MTLKDDGLSQRYLDTDIHPVPQTLSNRHLWGHTLITSQTVTNYPIQVLREVFGFANTPVISPL